MRWRASPCPRTQAPARAGLAQEQLREHAGLSRRGIADLERGARRAPYAHTVERLASALGLSDTERAALTEASRPTWVESEPLQPAPDPAEGVSGQVRHNL